MRLNCCNENLNNGIKKLNAKEEKMVFEKWETYLIGKDVEATMDGKTWFVGRLEKIIDLFVPYVVYVFESNECRGFIEIRGKE